MGFSNFNNDIALESTFPLKTDKSVVKKKKQTERRNLKRTNPHFFELKIEILTFRSNKKKIYLSLENFSYPLGLN